MNTKHTERLKKLKDLFQIKPNWRIVEHLIADMMNDRLRRNSNSNSEYIKEAEIKIDDIIYLLEELKKNYLSSFRCYKVFKMLLYAEKELQYFSDTIGDIKDYSPQSVIALIDKVKPFIVGEIKTRIPQNPNTVYNEIYFDFIDIYRLKKIDALNLLSIIYVKGVNSKKAKVPKRDIEELKKLKEVFVRIIEEGGDNKGYTREEIGYELKEINQIFKNYL